MTDSGNSDVGSAQGPTDLGTDVPHSARMYDYYLGGKDHFLPDRVAAEEALKGWPDARTAARANRAFMHRATRALVEEHGIRQFLDIGTGIPTKPNLHQVAQQVAPEARVVYADNDPIVLVHARALLIGTPEGRTAFVEGDVTRPEEILHAREMETLDLDKPVALSMNAVFHFVPDSQDPYGITTRFLEALAPGSALCLSHVTADLAPEPVKKIVEIYQAKGVPAQARTRGEVERFFTGLDLVDPGLVLAHRWQTPAMRGQQRSDITTIPTDDQVSLWAGVGMKT